MSELFCSLRRRIPAGAVPALCFLLCAWPAQPQTISTIAGNGVAAFSGDNGLASSASLNHPRGMAVDAGGSVYIGDTDNRRIRKVSAAGMIATTGGTGFPGFSGDGGPAVNAAFNDVTGLVLDTAGNLFVGDASNRRVRKISPSGIVTTVAGIGIEGFSGDGGPATSAMLGRPQSLAIDSAGNLYIADSTNQRVRKIAVNGTITTIAGNGQQGFSGDGGLAVNASLQFPVGVAVDRAGNLYVADGDNNRIRKIGPSGIISTFAGNGSGRFSGDAGLAVNATLDVPSDVAVDAAGNVYIADAGNNRVRKVDTSGAITTVAGTGTDGFSGDGGTATQAMLNFPWGLATDANGNVYVADRVNNRVRKIGLSLLSVAPTLNAVVNGASFSASMAVAPGSAVSIFGTDLAGTTLTASTTPLLTVLGDTSVSFNGTPAPLYYVSSTQVNAQVPFDLIPGPINVQVRRGSMVSATRTITVGAFSPGIFTVDPAGTGAILHAGNFSVVSAVAPARVGEFILIFTTGVGSLRTPFPSGAPAPSNPPAETLITPIVTIGGLSAPVSFSGLAPGFVGLYQLNVQVPASLAPGIQPVQIFAGGLFSNTATLAVTR